MTPPLCPYCDHQAADVHIDTLHGTILRCGRCRGLFARDRRSELERERSGGTDPGVIEAYERLIHATADEDRDIARRTLDLCLRSVPDARNVLEVGCGSASIGRAIDEEYPALTYRGIESSRQFHQAIAPDLRERVACEPDLYVAAERLADVPWDLILFSHVLEHLPRPRDVVDAFARRLAPGGRIYIEVPNEQWKTVQCRLRALLKPGEPAWFPGHINFFTAGSLRSILARAGMEVVHLSKGTAGREWSTVVKMMGGRDAFEANRLARAMQATLRWTHFERVIGYGIILRCLCRPAE